MNPLRSSTLTLLAIVILSAAGQPLHAADAERRLHPAALLSVRMGPADAQSSCTGGLAPTGKMTCGHPGEVSELTWVFLGSDAAGDRYRFTRRFPARTPGAETATKEVVFSGQPTVIWQDRFQTIALAPKL